jgi:secreted Zn-dependent insulinase-like peptidase
MDEYLKPFGPLAQLPTYLRLPCRNDLIVQHGLATSPFKAVPWEKRQKTPKLIQNGNVRVWHKKDDRFGTSKIHVRILIETKFGGLDAVSTSSGKSGSKI